MRAKDFDVQLIIDTLQGTCTETLQSAIETHYPEMSEDDLTSDDHNDIDNEIFECAECGWWCEQCQSTDKDGEPVCDDCNPENEED